MAQRTNTRLIPYLFNECLAVISAEVVVGPITILDILAPGFTTAKNGDVVLLINAITGSSHEVTLGEDISATSTRLTISSFTVDEYIPRGSILIQKQNVKWETIYKDTTLSHLHLYQQGGTHGNDFLINPQDPGSGRFTQNSSTIITDGLSKNNNWGARYGFINAPHNGAQIKKIDYIFTTDAGAGENFIFSLFKKPITPNGSTATTFTLIDSYTITSQNNSSYVFQSTVTPSASLGALTENDVIIPSIRKDGTKVSSTKVYGDIELLIEYDPR